MSSADRLHVREPGVEPSGRRKIAAATLCFALSAGGTILFCASYLFVSHKGSFGLGQNELVGTGLGIATGGLCIGLVLLGKATPPDSEGEEEREPHPSPPVERIKAQSTISRGFDQLGLRTHKVMRRTLLAALGLLPLPFLFGLRDLGPRPRALMRENAWRPDALLIDQTTLKPLHLGDLEIGAMTTVMPEGATDDHLAVNAESAVVVIHLPPGVNRPLPGREDWAVDDLVAYSKICTHAGCPVGLYEQQTHNLLCPCHQSTFFVPDACAVLFGPAARSLPQLPIYADAQGFIRARASFDEPLGPSFWERR
jgi:ubiquinol-cytochrome c reductase iron-sulfur subunit